MKLLSSKVKWCCVSMLLMLSSLELYASVLTQYPGAKLVSEKDSGNIEATIILSAPKRISNTIEIENQKTVSGKGIVRLYELKDSEQLEDVFKLYLGASVDEGTVVFQCEKRSCGSSNHWANKVFGEHKLYGRDSDQYYVAQLMKTGGTEQWTVAYIVKNGLREKYVYEQTVIVEKTGSAHETVQGPGVWKNGGLIEPGELSASQLAMIDRLLEARNARTLYLVALTGPESKVSQAYWEQLRKKTEAQIAYIRNGLKKSNIEFQLRLLGPFHEDETLDRGVVRFRLYAD